MSRRIDIVKKCLKFIDEHYSYFMPEDEQYLLKEMAKNFDPVTLAFEDDRYFGLKVWHRDDIRLELSDRGFATTDENVEKVLATGVAETLGDCNDIDWNVIEYAIFEADKDVGLERVSENG